jgi:VRR-NUC domain
VTRPAVREAHLQASVEQLLTLRRWKFVHHRNSIGTVAGWPDIFAVRSTRAIAIELKTTRGRVSREQATWIDALNAAGIEAFIARLPHDWARIEAVLR